MARCCSRLSKNRTIKVTPSSGAYKGVPVTVTPIRDKDGNAIGAIGVVDITGIFDLATLMEHQSGHHQAGVRERPRPLPGEQIDSKR